MPEEGHLRRMLPVIRGLRQRGIAPHVYTDARFGLQVTSAGGLFVDLFARHPLAVADDRSRPIPCRYVSFAGHFGTDIVREIHALAPALVVADTFAVIGQVVATALRIPLVNVCAGHNAEPGRFLAALADDPRVAVSPACERAVERLQTVHGLADASPFAYVTGRSRYLNIVCEPPGWLAPAERQAFEPAAFFGSLPSIEEIARRQATPGPPAFPAGTGEKIYVSFGTVVWRYYAAEALAALRAIADAVAARPGAAAVISLGGNPLADSERHSLQRDNVRVTDRVDQWAVLAEADVFVTHHGLNSTHEAIFQQVPMVSYPFFWDQPALAARCQSLGVATPLAEQPRAPVNAESTALALDRIATEREGMQQRLAEARQWELEVMDSRPAVMDRIAALIRDDAAF